MLDEQAQLLTRKLSEVLMSAMPLRGSRSLEKSILKTLPSSKKMEVFKA